MTLALLFFWFPHFAQRTGQESCWAKFRWDEKTSVCISHRVWTNWLKSDSPLSFCLNQANSKKVSAPLLNDLDHSESKKVEWIYFFDHSPINLTQNKKRISQVAIENSPPRSAQKISIDLDQETLNSNQCIYSWKWVEKLREISSTFLAKGDPWGIFRKLIINESTPKSPLPLLRLLGFVHLTTTSGIFLYIVYLGVAEIMKILCLTLKVPLRIGLFFHQVSTFILIFFLWLLSGARMGMIRPWAILAIRDCGKRWGIKWNFFAPLLIALVIDIGTEWIQLTLGFPKTGYSGRWVYTLALGGGLFWSQSFQSTHLSLAVGSWLALALWEGWESDLIALGTPLISLLTLPIFCWLGYPGILLSLFFHSLGVGIIAEKIFSSLSQIVHDCLFLIIQFSILLPQLWVVSKAALSMGMIVSAFLLFARSKKSRFLIHRELIICLSLIFITRHLFLNKNPQITPTLAKKVEQLDVGQGDAALIYLEKGKPWHWQQAGLIDTGSSRSLSMVSWIQLFAKRRITEIDWIGLTHLDEDHVGSLIQLASIIPIHCVSTSEEEINTEKGEKLLKSLAHYGLKLQGWESLCVPFPYLPPLSKGQNNRKPTKSQNMNMSAIWIPLKGDGFYLNAGDASAKDEIRIGKWARALSQDRTGPRILKISHHGSAYSTTSDFLSLIQPTEAWISSGLGNLYRHPSVQTLQKLKEFKILIRRTDLNGSLHSQEKKDNHSALK